MSDSYATASAVCDLPERMAAGLATPPGLRLVRPGRDRATLIPDVQIRCRAQPPDAPPLFARPRFAWNLNEVSGALGDLGTFLPHVLGAIAVAGLAPSGVLFSFGLFYLAAGAFYGVQPRKPSPIAASGP